MSRSPVFEAMLSGDFIESASDVVISDIEPPVFKDMLRFIYTEETNIRTDNVFYLMTAAKKYILDGLEGKCVKFLEDNIDTGNVCTVFDHAVSVRSAAIATKCLELIQMETLDVLDGESFLEMSQSSLTKLLECDYLSVDDEIHILEACKKWAEHKLREKCDSLEEKTRTILGGALFQIRFCSTTIGEIINRNLQDLLNAEHFKLLATCTMNKSSDNVIRVSARNELQQAGYNTNPRNYMSRATLRAVRFRETIDGHWNQGGIPDAIGFRINRPISLCGVSVYCSRNQTTDTCDIEVYDGVRETWTQKTSSILVSDGVTFEQDVMLEEPMRLEAGVDHAVKVTLRRGMSCFGQNGLTTTEVEGVTFSFMEHDTPNNYTDIERGQIPEIIFRHCFKSLN